VIAIPSETVLLQAICSVSPKVAPPPETVRYFLSRWTCVIENYLAYCPNIYLNICMKHITFYWWDPSNFTTLHPCMAVLAMIEMSLFPAVSLSVCQTHELWQNKSKTKPYVTRKADATSFGGECPLLLEILDKSEVTKLVKIRLHRMRIMTFKIRWMQMRMRI